LKIKYFNENKVSLPFLFIVVNLIIKSWYLLENPISFDEPFSIYHAQLDISSIIEQLSRGNNPPFYELFLHYWIKLFGNSPLSVRLPSLIFSSLTVFYIYKIGCKFYSINVGLIASLIFTFSNYHIVYAHEARVYPLFGLLTVVSMYYFLEIINKKNTLKKYIKLLLINLVLCYSHYFGFFIIFIQSFIFLIDRNAYKYHLKNYIKYLLLFILFYFPNLKILIRRFYESSSGTWVNKPTGLSNLFDMLSIFSNKPVLNFTILFIFILALSKYLLDKKKQSISVFSKTIIIWFFLPYLIMFFASYKIPTFLDRYLIFITIGYYILVSISINYLFDFSKFKYIWVTIIVFGFIFTFNPRFNNKRPIKEIVSKTLELRNNIHNSIIIISPKHYVYNYSYYYDKNIFETKFDDNLIENIANLLEKEKIYAINNNNDLNGYNNDNIIFLDAAANCSFPNNNIYISLKNTYKVTKSINYNNLYNIYLFQK